MNSSGHRLSYVALIAGALAELGSPAVLITGHNVPSTEEYAVHCGRLTCLTVIEVGDSTFRALWSALILCWRRRYRLVIPEGDEYLPYLLLIAPTLAVLNVRVVSLVLRTPSWRDQTARRIRAGLKAVLVSLVAALLPQLSLYFLTDAFGVVQRRPGYRLQSVRDPIILPDERSEGDESTTLHLAAMPRQQGPVVGVVGAISARKNLSLVGHAITGIPGASLSISGKISPSAQEEVAELSAAFEQITVDDRLLRPHEFHAAMKALDIAAVLYENHDSPSGVIAQAAARGVPVVVPTGGWLAEVVKSTGIGLAVNLEASAVREAISSIFKDYERYSRRAFLESRKFSASDFIEKIVG